MRFTSLVLPAALGSALLVACSDGGPTAPVQRLEAIGRLERGGTVRLAARDGAAADSLVTNVVLAPATAGTVTGGTVKLLATGPVTVTATASSGATLTTQLEVVAPPTVFFDASDAGNRDLYSVALDGAELKRWTTDPAEDAYPTVAGGTVVFVSTRGGNADLYSFTLAAGATVTRLTTTAASESFPTLSAGGSKLAYATDAVGLPHVYVAPPTLVGPARLTATSFGFGGSLETHPTWSPGGDRIAFVATANGQANLFIAAATAGSVPATVAGSGAQQTDVEPVWSPDGNRIAFASTRAGGTQLFVLDLTTGVYTQLTTGTTASGQPAWLADGRLVYTSFASGESTLWWIDPALPTQAPVAIPTATLKTPAHATAIRP